MNFDKKTLWDLRQEIRLGSLFYRDYENSYGVDEHDCCDFFDGFIEWYEYERKDPESPYYQNKDSWFYDNPEDLWDYYCMYEDEALPIQKDEDDDWEYESKKRRGNMVRKVSEEYIKAPYEDEAKQFCMAIEKLANNKDALENFESYISHHFQVWLNKWARTPEDIISEFEHFANI